MLGSTSGSLHDQRHRAPFAHTSSSADLTSPELVSTLRSFPTQQTSFRVEEKPVPVTRIRSPAPNPFQIPTLTFPGFETVRFISLCTLWYASSAVSSNTGKVILNHFKFPVTLTIVQFFFVALYCVVCGRLGWTRLRTPTRAILRGVLPMAAFQVGGHIFGSLAISRVPVSTVHTIKALSPLFTVLAYALLFGVSYSPATYLSLLPLTIGVMLACSFDITISNILGLICAFGSTLIFVSQNIFFKKIMPTNSDTTGLGAKLDKLNLLYFSSSMAFVLMIPVWLYSDAIRLWTRIPNLDGPSISFYFFVNGTVHFAQNLLAFAILSSTSPVTYSIASLVKRIAVICLAIVWFKQAVHPVQAIGIGSTAVGLWMYNNAKRDVEKGEKRLRQVEAARDGLLPTSKTEARDYAPSIPFDTKANSSPKPVYHDFLSSSISSAVRGPAFDPKPTGVAETVYPSPPASITSSPPANAIIAPIRSRRLSEISKDAHFRLPPPVTNGIIAESHREMTA